MGAGWFRAWIFVVASLCVAANVTAAEDMPAPYLIQAGDVVTLSVWHEPDMQTEAMVRPDGVISVPLVGDILAQGKSTADVRGEVAKRLEKLIPDAVVNVTVKQALGNKIYVLGKVSRPGEYVVARDVDVMQALSLAGGTVKFASLERIKVLRRAGDAERQAIPFNYQEVQDGVRLEQNIVLRSGDVVVVP